ncbi:selenocysteine lyase-like isoform X2 [Tubulanus polymorphus]|uniref:selenocysteine lyase-like isoform X2 n=1 Tax=Tubulanus polymorphus TaxID=672921 RepID=UPI003DA39DB2
MLGEIQAVLMNQANNLVFHTIVKSYHRNSKLKPHVISSDIEHDSVKLVLEKYRDQGDIDLSYVPIQISRGGVIDVDDVISCIRPNTCLISLMLANNEIGSIQPIFGISQQVRTHTPKRTAENLKLAGLEKILIHTDAAQAIGKIPVDVNNLAVDYLTIVGHKFYAPRIGALYVRDLGETSSAPLIPMFYGGGQERNFRPGTENTGMIAGLGKAAELVTANIENYSSHMRLVRNYLEKKLVDMFGRKNLHFNGKDRLPNTCNVSILSGLTGAEILSKCKLVQASVGAACHAQNIPSHILWSIGISKDIASKALRLSVGRHTSFEDIDRAVEDIRQALANDT